LCSSSFMTKHKMSDRVERERKERRMKATEKFISIKFHSAVIVDECTEKFHDCIAMAIRAFHCCFLSPLCFHIYLFFWSCKICSRNSLKEPQHFFLSKAQFFPTFFIQFQAHFAINFPNYVVVAAQFWSYPILYRIFLSLCNLLHIHGLCGFKNCHIQTVLNRISFMKE